MKITAAIITLLLSVVTVSAAIPGFQERERHREECMENLRVMGEAIKAYRADYSDQMPDWLSDLYPKYLQDPQILLCPADDAGTAPDLFVSHKDPKMSCSYVYTFNPLKPITGWVFHTNAPEEMTSKEDGYMTLEYFGGITPVVMCHHHSPDVDAIHLGYDCKPYQSLFYWQHMPEAARGAMSFFQKAIDRNPDGWEKEINLDEIFRFFTKSGRSSDLLVLLERQPNPSADILRILANTYKFEGKIDKAIQIYQRLLGINPNNMGIRMEMARYYASQARYEESRAQCRKIMELDPDNPGAQTLLLELDAVVDARRIQRELSGTRMEDPEVRYLVKLEEMILSSREDFRPAVEKAKGMARGSFGETKSVKRLGRLYQALESSLSAKSWHWKTYTTADGLISDRIHAAKQDSRGIMWIGTDKGVCTYNGESFVPFTENEQLREGYINSLLIDSKENLWFGVSGYGIIRYDGTDFVSHTAEDGLTSTHLLSSFEDRSGAMWFIFWQGGICRYDGEAFQYFSTEDGLPSNLMHGIWEDSKGIIWIGTNAGVSMYDGTTFTSLTEEDGLAYNKVLSILGDRNGYVWIGTDKGLSRYDGRNFTNFTTRDGLPDNIIKRILEDREGRLWFVSGSTGVSWYDGNKFTSLREQDGLARNFIENIFEDREGNIWFAHGLARGLSQLNPRGLRNYGAQDGLVGTAVRLITEDHQGALWLVTDAGVEKYDGATFTQPVSDGGGVLGDVNDILEDSAHNMWFATNLGLFRYDGAELTRFTTLNGLHGNNAQCLMEDTKGRFWASIFWCGLSRYDGDQFTNFSMEDKLTSANGRSLAEDHDGNIWIGDWGSGLIRYDGERFTNFSMDDGLAHRYVSSVLVDAEGQIWVGTSNGVSKYDGSPFTELPQVSGKYITDIAQDKDGNIWFGVVNGGVIKTDGRAFTNITTDDGLPSNSVYDLQADRKGNIWIGTQEGLTRYTPNPTPPLIHIESIVADKVYERPVEISLPASAGHLRITYRGISFRTRPESIQYLYQMEGRETDWQGPIHERSVDYLGLGPGEYTFKVKAVDIDLNYSYIPASVSIHIAAPPFYQTGVFLISLSIMGGASLLVAIFLGIKHWRASRAEQVRLWQELEDAHQMQLRLLPESAPSIEGFDMAGFSWPAREVGGDFYDYLSLANGRTGIVIGDVSGKGLKAAMNAVLASGMLQEASRTETSCSGVLFRLNQNLHERMDDLMFTAVGFAILGGDSRMQWANAAQPRPLVRRDGQLFEFYSEGKLPLSMLPDMTYPESELDLQSGDVVLFYTDGIIEAENEAQEMYGTERLEQAMSHIDPAADAEAIIKAILQDVTDFVGDAEQYDDMTTVVVKKV